MGQVVTGFSGIYLVTMVSRRAMNMLDQIAKTVSGKVWEIANRQSFDAPKDLKSIGVA